jgi:hypothetical protein
MHLFTLSTKSGGKKNHASDKKLINNVTIFKNMATGKYFGDDSFDAYVFFPRVVLVHGRPNWMISATSRKLIRIPSQNRVGRGLRLIQAYVINSGDTSVPTDQVVINDPGIAPYLALPKGSYRIRTINGMGDILATSILKVK